MRWQGLGMQPPGLVPENTTVKARSILNLNHSVAITGLPTLRSFQGSQVPTEASPNKSGEPIQMTATVGI